MNPVKKLFLNEFFILVLISINALLIFGQGFPDSGIKDILSLIDDGISILFLCEMVIKISHYGLREYLKSGWNKFDLLLVTISLPSILLHFLPEGTDMINLSMLLVLRVFRVFKFFRFIKFFPKVEQIFLSARQAVAASGMVLAGFFVFIFIMSLLCCYLFRDIAPTTFGNPLTAYYSTFQVFTVEGWNAIPAEVEKESAMLNQQAMLVVDSLKTISAPTADVQKALEYANSLAIGSGTVFFMRMLFVTLFIIGGVFGLSIVNSIFVEAMVSNSNDEMEDDLDKLRIEFHHLNEKIDTLTVLLAKKGKISNSDDKPDEV
jgi:voltage-gated sodium channel